MSVITVAIPVYNKKEYLAECFASLENQTKSTFQVLMIDDGSTDGSAELCEAYAEKSDNYRVVHFENAGLLQSRRRAIALIPEGYVVFLDADDYLSENAIDYIDQASRKSNADIISFGMRMTNSSYRQGNLKKSINNVPQVDNFPIEEARKWILEGGSNNLCGKAIKRECFNEELDYYRFENLMHGEDLLQSLEVFDKAKSFAFLREDLYYYRRNQDSSTSYYKCSQRHDISKVLAELKKSSLKWTSSTYAYAIGATVQYCYLFSLLELSGVSGDELTKERENIRREIEKLLIISPKLILKLKPNNALLVRAISKRKYKRAHFLIKCVHLIKVLLKRGG